IVKKMFDRRFPPGTEFGTPLPSPPFVQPPPPRTPGNLVQRVIAYITKREERDQAAFVAEQKKAQDEYMKQVHEVAAAGLPPEEMEGRLAQAVEVTTDDLRTLVDARAQAVRDYLMNTGKIAPER